VYYGFILPDALIYTPVSHARQECLVRFCDGHETIRISEKRLMNDAEKYAGFEM
jgi:hypothetical protein